MFGRLQLNKGGSSTRHKKERKLAPLSTCRQCTTYNKLLCLFKSPSWLTVDPGGCNRLYMVSHLVNVADCQIVVHSIRMAIKCVSRAGVFSPPTNGILHAKCSLNPVLILPNTYLNGIYHVKSHLLRNKYSGSVQFNVHII